MAGIGIHGFGRIGRLTLRAALQQGAFLPLSISDIHDPRTFAALFQVDSNLGRWPEPVYADEGKITIGSREIRYIDSRDSLPDWGDLGVDTVVDCSSLATTRAGAEAHLAQGARRVLVSAPSKSAEDCDAILLPGINLDEHDPAEHRIVSMGSCTTNALAPVVSVLLEGWGIESGFFATVHAYTSTQSLIDQPMRARRDSWAATENIIPSSSGAAKALGFIWPGLNMTGKSYRVPVRTGSIVELSVNLTKATDREELCAAFRKAATGGPLQGIMDVVEDEYPSAYVVGETHSSIVDLPLLQMLSPRFLSVAAWYDNETGYAHRLVETARAISDA